MFIHLITMCVGLIIAFGLQQIIEGLQRRRRIRKARAGDLAEQTAGEPAELPPASRSTHP
jgi:hypothetical protein